MSTNTRIEWCEATYNPIIGCTKISEGCKNCYAEKMAYRLANIETTNYYGNVVEKINKPISVSRLIKRDFYQEWNGRTHFVKSQIDKPLKWKKPRMIFVCSMGDLFHESVPFEWVDDVFSIIYKCPQHTFQILTKRPARMKQYFENRGIRHPYLNVWIGVTAENQEQANKRIPILLQIPAKVRFISCEPLLTDIDFPWYQDTQPNNGTVIKDLDWVIAGPETGPGARPMQKEWIENIFNQCKAANVPFFDKKNSLGLNLKQFTNE